MARGAKPGKAKGEGKRPVARKSPKNEGSRVRDLEKRLAEALKDKAEALEQQTATAEILRVISNLPSDYQPVFDTIVRSAGVVCGAADAILWIVDGDELVVHAHHGPLPARIGAQQPIRGSVAGYAVHEARVIHIEDVTESNDFPVGRDVARRLGWRTVLSAPLLRGGLPIGAILIRRREVRPFTESQIKLLETFADQAVIAIENVRLFKELQARNRDLTEALKEQTATSEVLKVISRSTFDLQPVLETLVENATKLCSADKGFIFRRDGEVYRLGVASGASPEFKEFVDRNPIPPGRGTIVGRVALERRTVHIADVLADPEYRWNESQQVGRFRTLLGVPMLREGVSLGVIAIWREEVRPFTEKQIELVTTFADQAVIAIENVRLFTELQEKNRALTKAHAQVTESFEQQTATSEILRVIASSPTDVQPVFDAIVASAVRLLGGYFAGLTRIAGDQIELAALTSTDDAGNAALKALYPRPVHSQGAHGQAIRDRAPVNILDMHTDLRVTEAGRDAARIAGYRSVVTVPLLRHDEAIGALGVTRRDPGGFTDDEIGLLQTFADQAVIAIENVRLFRELEAANRELGAASRHKSEFLANMSHELRTPLNAVIGFSEVLLQRMFGELNTKQDEYLKDIYASGQHLLSLINDILDLSKIEAGRMELEPADFDLPSAIDNALILVRERATRRGITLGRTIDARLGVIHGDERKVKQVLLNLLSNALKFTPEGGRIDVRAALRERRAEVSVADTGVGIAPEDQAAVFEEFRQVGTAEKKVEGTGLGLALSQKFVQLHGGRLWVESELGRGATFTFTLPVS
jgi:signal transduction histidine kinase